MSTEFQLLHRGIPSHRSILRRPLPKVSNISDTYWLFAAERQRVFFRRVRGLPAPWTSDPIIQAFKFTNAYRASDRVSQYLIRNVIHGKHVTPADTVLRVLLFKIFNKVSTWEVLEAAVEAITTETFSVSEFDLLLSSELKAGRSVYSAAYIMPSGGRNIRKHRAHLELLATMLKSRLPDRLLACDSMADGFKLLLSYPTVGPFLAYQWITDLNYTPVLNFDEMEFVFPGPGARDGIRKCFDDLRGWTEPDVIRLMADTQADHFQRLGIEFPSLWGRPLQLIDCQNLFCEVDKYARVRHPEVAGISGRRRIKQRFSASFAPIQYTYPAKWNLDTSTSNEGLPPRDPF